jgi:hypothetical protein
VLILATCIPYNLEDPMQSYFHIFSQILSEFT